MVKMSKIQDIKVRRIKKLKMLRKSALRNKHYGEADAIKRKMNELIKSIE